MSDGFRRFETARTALWVADDYADEIAPLRLDTEVGLARWCATGADVSGGRARGWRLALASGRAVHLRELAHGGLLRGLTGRRFLDFARGARSLTAAAELGRRGVAVPAPVLMHARRRGAFWQVAVANEFIESSEAGGAFLEHADPAATTLAARSAGARVRDFHDAGGRHPDLHVDNLLVRSDGRLEVFVVDLDGVRLGDSTSTRERRSELLRLLRSLRKRPLGESTRRRVVAAFVRGYLGRDADLRARLLRNTT